MENSVKRAIKNLNVMLKVEKREFLSFEEFLKKTQKNPLRLLRNIFQLFCDFIKDNVGPGVDEYPDDPESIGFVRYNLAPLLSEGMDYPFFADRLFANRLVRLVEQMRTGANQQNKIFIFEGPPGCGKSIFLNNLLLRFGEYTDQPAGETFEVVWRLEQNKEVLEGVQKARVLEIPCPSHDNPFLVFPKNIRRDLLEQILSDTDSEIRQKILESKEYEWLLKGSCCPICKGVFYALLDKFESFNHVQNAIFARTVKFDRILGEGISVFSPGDSLSRQRVLTDKGLQERLDDFFGSSNTVRYLFSRFAKTNEGVYALMDVRGENTNRLTELHGIVSEGYHKIDECVEEPVKSLFLVVANPGDIVVGKKSEKTKGSASNQKGRGLVVDQAFVDRLGFILTPYVTEVSVEVDIYKSTFGSDIQELFLPGILENFARVIISSRLNTDSPALKEWLGDDFAKKYEKYCDSDGLLLKMAVYGGKRPSWLSEEDVRNFTKDIRQKLILKEGAEEGKSGISGRDALLFFGDFCSRIKPKRLATMADVDRFFRDLFKQKTELKSIIPSQFLDSLMKWYNYMVIQQIKESLYDYNEQHIRKDVVHYIFATSQDLGQRVVCPYTKEVLEITEDFFRTVEDHFLFGDVSDDDRKYTREDTMEEYARLLAQEGTELNVQNTEIFESFYQTYIFQLKEGVLNPFLKNSSFRDAIKAYGDSSFEIFDKKIKSSVSLMMKNLCKLYNYTEQGAKEVCIYILDNDIISKFEK